MAMSSEAIAPAMSSIAQNYARLGLLVFPIAARSKVPLTPRGFRDASDDPDQVRRWWREWPDANIGIACGEASGLFVVDVDGPGGEASLAELLATHGPLPLTAEVRTGKGRHLYFRHFPGARNSASKLGPGIDTRGEGGYVVAPPSIHPSGAVYEWAPGRSPREQRRCEAPAWIVSALEKRPTTAASTWSPPADDRLARAYVTKALSAEHDEVARAPAGTRNEALARAAYGLGGYVPRLEEREIVEALVAAAKACGVWAEDGEARCMDTIRRGVAKGMESPRPIPEPRMAAWSQPENDTRTPSEVVPLEPATPQRRWKTAAELVMEMRDAGPGLPTGLPTLDEWTKGGLRQGKLVAIAGAPGAGKTLLAAQLGHVFHGAGHPVALYAADEPRTGMMVRWGQMCGLVRDDLEKADEHTRRALAREVSEGRVDFVEADEATLEEVAQWLLYRAQAFGMPAVLVIDSIQTARVENGDALEPKARVDIVVRLLKSFRNRGLIVIATSEVPRSWYARADEAIDPMAAFKESGAIEYALDLALVLASVKGENGNADVWVPKNRIWPRSDRSKPAFRTTIDFARARMSETAAGGEADGEPYDDSEDVEETAKAMLLALARASGDVCSRADLCSLVKVRRGRAQAAASALITSGRIQKIDGKYCPARSA